MGPPLCFPCLHLTRSRAAAARRKEALPERGPPRALPRGRPPHTLDSACSTPASTFDVLQWLAPLEWCRLGAVCSCMAQVSRDPSLRARLVSVAGPAFCNPGGSLVRHVVSRGTASGVFCLLASSAGKGGACADEVLCEREAHHGRTALMEATYYSAEPAAVALLLQQRADPNAQSNFGSTALLSACYMKGRRHVELLLEHKADPLLADHAGDNALHCAAYAGWTEAVDMFLAAGVPIDVPNHAGWTALRYAYQEHHGHLAEWLKQRGARECAPA